MADFEVKFNTTMLLAGAESAFGDANMILGRELQKRITDNRWGWPTDPSPRDIVDKGQLRDSYTPTAISKTEHEHAWNTEYAMAVHEGVVFQGGRSMPARPWVRVTLREFDFADAYGKLAQSELARVKDPP